FWSVSASAQQNDLLRAEDAFRFSVERDAGGRIVLRWDIADGYYLYREHLAAKNAATGGGRAPDRTGRGGRGGRQFRAVRSLLWRSRRAAGPRCTRRCGRDLSGLQEGLDLLSAADADAGYSIATDVRASDRLRRRRTAGRFRRQYG